MIDTHDVCLGSSTSDASARVLVTTTDAQSATALVEALQGASLFQCEGLVPFARRVDRTAPAIQFDALPELAALPHDEAPAAAES